MGFSIFLPSKGKLLHKPGKITSKSEIQLYERSSLETAYTPIGNHTNGEQQWYQQLRRIPMADGTPPQQQRSTTERFRLKNTGL